MRKYFLTALVLLFTANAFSQNDGSANTGLSFLKLGAGARSMAMGDAYSSVCNDGTAFIYNPARLNAGPDNNVTLMYNSAMQDLTNNYIGAKVRYSKLGIGFGLLKTSVSDIEVRTIPGALIDKFDAQNLAMGISLSYEIYKNLSFGITSKLIYEKIYIEEASGVGFDFGTNYSRDNYSLSFVLSNLGSINELKDASTKLPSSVRFGGAYNIKKNNLDIILALEGYKVLDGGKLHINSGAEIGYKDLLYVRLGYQTAYENKGFTSGIGLKYKGILLDYAFIPYSDSFGASNTISLGFNF
ncbi:MAG: PorV/PorQ family protein [Ignavibacteriae bacterium]|nr:PorV/PorQ family protein [Ignavibacteriota bacterium]